MHAFVKIIISFKYNSFIPIHHSIIILPFDYYYYYYYYGGLMCFNASGLVHTFSSQPQEHQLIKDCYWTKWAQKVRKSNPPTKKQVSNWFDPHRSPMGDVLLLVNKSQD